MKPFVLFVTLWWFSASAVLAADSGVIRVACSESPPFTSKHARFGGFILHLVRAAFEPEGYTVHVAYINWSRVSQKTREGEFDIAAYAYDDPIHHQDFLLSDTLVVERLVLVSHTRHPLPPWQSIFDLAGQRLGLTRGYTYTDDIWRFARQYSYYTSVVNTDLQNLEMLLKRRIDMFPIAVLQGRHIVQNALPHEAEQLNFGEQVMQYMHSKLLFPKSLERSETLRDLFNQRLAVLRESGQHQQMIDNLEQGFYSVHRKRHSRQRDGGN